MQAVELCPAQPLERAQEQAEVTEATDLAGALLLALLPVMMALVGLALSYVPKPRTLGTLRDLTLGSVAW